MCNASFSVFRIPNMCPYLYPCGCSAMHGPETEFPSETGADHTPAKKKRNCGKHTTTDKQVAQFLNDVEVRQGKMWCEQYAIEITFTDKNFATVHARSADHKKHRKEMFVREFASGPKCRAFVSPNSPAVCQGVRVPRCIPLCVRACVCVCVCVS